MRIDDIRSSNDNKPFGVAAYYLGRLLRSFGGADAPKTFDTNPVSDFVARQIYRPLVFRRVGNYGGYFGSGMGVRDVTVKGIGGFGYRDYVTTPGGGVQVGSVVNHPAATSVYLNPDGTYDARDAAGAVVVSAGQLPDVVLAVAGAPGTSMKVEVKPRVPAGMIDPAVDGSLTFLSTSVGAEVVIPDPATPVAYQASVAGPAGTEARTFTVPDKSALAAAINARGVNVQEFSRPLVRVRPDGAEIARAFDDTGLRRVRVLADHTFAMSDPTVATVAAGPDLASVLFREGPPLGGRQRFPTWFAWGEHKLTLYGLARGGTLVYDTPDEQALDPAGGVFALPGAEPLRQWLRQHKVAFEG